MRARLLDAGSLLYCTDGGPLRIVGGALFLAACAADEPVETWAIELRGRVIGVEERLSDGTVRRTYADRTVVGVEPGSDYGPIVYRRVDAAPPIDPVDLGA